MIQSYMKERKLTIRRLAKQIDMDHCTLTRILHGESTHPDKIVKLLTWMLGDSVRPS